MILCACGCGQSFNEADRYGRKRLYLNGHNKRGKPSHHKPGPVEPRFWANVDKTGECWVWTGYLRKPWMYGETYMPAYKRAVKAHRASWEIHFGPIPEGVSVLHHCDNPPCVRPDHLFLGNQAANIRDMMSKGRHGKTGVKGSLNPHARLTEDDIREIRRRRAEGEGYAAIGATYRLSRGNVWAIVNGKSWRHVA